MHLLVTGSYWSSGYMMPNASSHSRSKIDSIFVVKDMSLALWGLRA